MTPACKPARPLIRRFARTAAAAALAAALAPAAGAERDPSTAAADRAAAPFRADYAVAIGGLRVGVLSFEVSRSAGGYAARARMEAAGLAGFLFPGAAQAEAEGGIGPDATPVPRRFAADGLFGATRQRVAMAFDGGALSMEADPPLRLRDYDADLAAMGDALDPLSAAVAALAPVPAAAACGRTLSVFDSRRRFDLALGPATEAGGTLRCEGRFRRVAGYKAKHLAREDAPFTVWFSVSDGRATLLRAQAPTAFGHAVAVRRSASGA